MFIFFFVAAVRFFNKKLNKKKKYNGIFIKHRVKEGMKEKLYKTRISSVSYKLNMDRVRFNWFAAFSVTATEQCLLQKRDVERNVRAKNKK